MEAKQLTLIAELRKRNFPYSFIGRELGMSPNTVKSICRRNGFMANGSRKTKLEKTAVIFCKNCHRPLPENARSDAAFCSDSCRTEWRRKHRTVTRKMT